MREISVRELIYNVFVKWKSALVVALCCMLLFVAWQWLGTEKAVEVSKIDRGQFSEEELQEIDEYHQAAIVHKELLEYTKTAPLMRLNPTDIAQVMKQYLIHCDDTRELPALISAYTQYVASGAIIEKIENSNQYTGELIEISNTDYSAIQGDRNEDGSVVITIKVFNEDVEGAETLMESVEKAIFEYSKTMNEIITKHTMESIYHANNRSVEQRIVTWQADVRNRLAQANTNYEKLHNALTLEQLKYIEQEYSEVESDTSVAEVSSGHISFKYLILAAIASVLVAIMYTVLSYVIQNKIQSPNEMEKSLGLRMLGVLPNIYENEQSKYRKKITRARFGKYADLDSLDNVEQFIENMKFFMGKERVEKIYIEWPQEIQDSIKGRVDDALAKQGIDIYQNDKTIVKQVDLREMRAAGNIVFVKQVGVSTYDEAEQEIALCKKNDINILGVALAV